MLENGLRIDVKTTYPQFNLIWSNTINDIYDNKVFDVLVSVSINEKHFSECWIEGWITRDRFLRQKLIADGLGPPRLEPGTWFINKATLSNIDDLVSLPPLRKAA